MTSPVVCATPHVSRCTAASSRQAAAATSAWTARKDRAAAPHSPSGNHTPSPSCRRPTTRQGSWTKISMGARAHTNGLAPARRLSSASRSALRAALRVTERRHRRYITTSGPPGGTTFNNNLSAQLDNGQAAQISSHQRAASRTVPSGQSGQRRSLAQHGPSGLRAVAGAASATSAAASSPPRKRAPRRRRGRPRPGRGMSPFALAGPAMPDGTKAIEGHPRPHARACVRRPSARPGDVPRSG